MPFQQMTPREQRIAATAVAVSTVTSLGTAGALNAALDALNLQALAGQFWRPHGLAIIFWRHFVAANGVVPDFTVTVPDHDMNRLLADAIEDALTRGRSSARTAYDFLDMLRLDRWAMLRGKRPTQEAEEDLIVGIDQFFIRELNRAHLGAQVCSGVASRAELDALDEDSDESSI